ncbi:GNAT family N-acetyltransferase [Lichenihabitans sp. PAMC28606]|uniref:GNAT family N-acetyltransferase n=1 Tax=Lichenihabitans sp. PAMC28606 TaxID=2880932 RepID=UPI001D0AC945|nr:GNAT family N-acetyltransferase [Lichenihabitans sp. PAMC28606]UDL96443.1 GNAT family N-acetyltransferase [Lichenihabitans sp. PAMC28606]
MSRGLAGVRIAPVVDLSLEAREAVLELWVAAWADAMPSIDFAGRRPWFATRLDDHLRDGDLMITANSDHDGLLGFALVAIRTGYLDQLAVAPLAQRHGVASALVADAQRRCACGLDLHVNQDNVGAVAFYQRHGFEVVGTGANPRSGLPIWSMAWRPPST